MTQEVHIDIPQRIYEKSLDMTGGSRDKLPKLFLHMIINAVEQEEKKNKVSLSEDVAWFKKHPVILTEEEMDERTKYQIISKI